MKVPFDTEIVDVVATIKGSDDANRYAQLEKCEFSWENDSNMMQNLCYYWSLRLSPSKHQ